MALAGLILVLNLANNAVLESVSARWFADRRVDLATAFSEAEFPHQRRQSAGSLVAITEQIASASRVIASDLSLPGTAGRAVIYLGAALVASWQTALVAGGSGAALMLALRLIALLIGSASGPTICVVPNSMRVGLLRRLLRSSSRASCALDWRRRSGVPAPTPRI